MFRNAISNTPFADTDCALYNGVPVSSSLYNDYSFGNTLRALLVNRVNPEVYKDTGEYPVTYSLRSCSLNSGMSDSRVLERLLEFTPFDIDSKDKLLVCEITSVDEYWDMISEKFPGFLKDRFDTKFEEVKKVREFFKKSLSVLCFINTENRTSLVFMEKRGIECHHYIQMAIPTYLPWYFDKETNPITPLELKLIKTLKERSSDKYIEVLEEMSREYKLDEIKLINALGGFEKKWAEKNLNHTKDRIQSLSGEIERLYTRLGEFMTQRRDAQMLLTGIMAKIDNTESKTLDYFKSNNCLVFDHSVSDTIYFWVDTFLEVFDESAAESFIDNKNSLIYRRSVQDESSTEKVFRAVFIDQTIKVKMAAKYNLSIGCNEVQGISYPEYKPYMENHLKNPHIHHFHCLGDYGRMMYQALESEDAVGALELCCMSARSLNFGDSAVMERFVPEFTNNGSKHFVLPTGECTNFEGVVEYLEEQEAEKTEEEK